MIRNMNAHQAIKRSVSHNEIVHIDYSVSNRLTLDELCDDSVRVDSHTYDCWGTDGAGNEWRVIMHGLDPE